MPVSPIDPLRPSIDKLPPKGFVRIAPFQAIPDLLVEMGIDPLPVIAEAGIDPALFDAPDNTIAFQDVGRLLALGADRAHCPDLGLRLGETMTPTLLGLVGALGNSAPDVGTGLSNMVRYFHLHDRGAVPAMEVRGDQVVLSYTFYEPCVPAVEQIYDAAIMYGQGIMRTLAGPQWKPIEVHFSRAAPECIDLYRRRFRCRVRFGAPENATVFVASWLDCPVVSADAPTHRALAQLVEVLDEDIAADLVGHLRHTLRALLIGDLGEQPLSLERTSQALVLHRRTLNRRLRERGTSFKALVDEARYDIARQLLRDTGLPALRIAGMLGYADATAFTRAFRRWSGTTPAAWRSVHQRT